MVSRDEALRRIKAEARDHETDCDCRTCRAAAGDAQARNELLRELV